MGELKTVVVMDGTKFGGVCLFPSEGWHFGKGWISRSSLYVVLRYLQMCCVLPAGTCLQIVLLILQTFMHGRSLTENQDCVFSTSENTCATGLSVSGTLSACTDFRKLMAQTVVALSIPQPTSIV